MKATDVIRLSLQQSQQWLMALASEMKETPVTAPTPSGGNHPLWVMGHVACSRG